MKKLINRSKKYLKIKNSEIIILIFLLLLVFLKTNKFFENSFKLLNTSYDLRLQQSAYSYCDNPGHKYSFGSGAGYIWKIKKKYNLQKIPIIKNFHSAPSQRWIFGNVNEIDKSKVIVLFNLDNDGVSKFESDGYKVLDNFNNNCLFLEKDD